MKRLRKPNIENELRSGAPKPRPELVETIALEIRERTTERRAPWRRGGLALALTSLMLVAVASFGGVGYAASAGSQAVQKVVHVRDLASAAAAQYKHFTAPKANVAGANKTATTTTAPTTTGTLPFTGLALWVPLAGGIVLIAFGLLLRSRTRRRESHA